MLFLFFFCFFLQCFRAPLFIDALWSREEDIQKVFTLCGHGSSLRHVTINIRYKFTPLDLRNLQMNFEIN